MLIAFSIPSCSPQVDVDRLPSWNAGGTRDSIVRFVNAVTDSMNKNFVPANERIAVFDNDGTLWSEQPLYFQFYYALAQLEKAAAAHPELAEQEPFGTALRGNRDEILALGTTGLVKIVRHTDADREWAYDRESHLGRLDKALDEADANGWTVVDMQADWVVVYPVE